MHLHITQNPAYVQVEENGQAIASFDCLETPSHHAHQRAEGFVIGVEKGRKRAKPGHSPTITQRSTAGDEQVLVDGYLVHAFDAFDLPRSRARRMAEACVQGMRHAFTQARDS